MLAYFSLMRSYVAILLEARPQSRVSPITRAFRLPADKSLFGAVGRPKPAFAVGDSNLARAANVRSPP